MHAVFDEASLARQAREGAVEKTRDHLSVSVRAAMETSRLVDEMDLDNLEKQSGKRLSATDFETRIKKLVPKVKFDTNHLIPDYAKKLNLTEGSTTRRMFFERNDGTMQYLGAYLDQALIPEHTILLQRNKRAPVPITETREIKAIDGSWVKVPFINGKDIPKAEPDGSMPASGPGYTTIKEAAGTIPGWRTLLAVLVGHGLTNPTEVEREFGSSDKLSWAVRMGRKNEYLPF